MSALLAAALFAPALWLVLLHRAPTAAESRRWTSAFAVAVAAVWLLVVLVDGDAAVGRFGASAVPVGTWLLAASITWPTRRLPTSLLVVTAAIASGGASLLDGGGDASDAAGALALAAAAVLVTARSEGDGGMQAAVGAVLGSAGVAFGIAAEAETLALAGAAVVVVSSTARVRRAGVLLFPLAIAIASSVPTLQWSHAALLAVVAAVAASRPGMTLALWALVAAAVGSDPVLLGGAAVAAAVALHPVTAIAAVPGVAALVATDPTSRWSMVVALLGVITALRLWRDEPDTVPGGPTRATVAALALGAWLLLAPETWSDAPGLETWGTGVLVAAVAGAIGAFLVASFTEVTFTVPDVEVADPAYAPRDQRWSTPAAIGALVVLAIAGGTLVASSLS